MQRIATLPALLPEYTGFGLMRAWARPDLSLGWGLKPSSLRAAQRARRLGIPHVVLEDGFLRSLGLGVEGHPPCSIAVDHTGVYYDATRRSDLETLIIESEFSAAELQRARDCMALIRQHRLSKYNHAPDHAIEATGRPRVLVVDQTAGDASIRYGLADAARFTSMLDAALAEHPEAEVLVKIHPDVLAGRKRGHLLDAAQRHSRCRIFAQNVNPWSLLDAVDVVHVVTSQLGLEALIAGRRVVCHGVPFYAGWGLTDDRLTCDRRGLSRSLEQVFAAAYLRYCRYANPFTGERSTLEETIDLLADQRRQREQHGGNWTAVGFSRWKRSFVGDFLGSSARVEHVSSVGQFACSGTRALVWSSNSTVVAELDALPTKADVWRMEDGFMRSVGLGVDLVRPISLVIDSRGIHYDPRHPSDLEHLLANTDFSPQLLARAHRLRQRIVDARVTKYNVGTEQALPLPDGRRKVLVVGQVETDASVRCAAPHIASNDALLRLVRQLNPEAFILYKPHPDVVTGARIGQIGPASKHLIDREVNDLGITDLLDVVDELHTMSSLAGFEALLRGVEVHTWGTPFYAGWGLTVDHAPPCPRRTRTLALDELVAATLILYPTYVDPSSGRLINAETALQLLERRRSKHRGSGLLERVYRVYRNTFVGPH